MSRDDQLHWKVVSLTAAMQRRDAAGVAALLYCDVADVRLLMQSPELDGDKQAFTDAYQRIVAHMEEYGIQTHNAERLCTFIATGILTPPQKGFSEMTTLVVLVPKADTAARDHIDPGSGIVALDDALENAVVYYEGNRYGASNLTTFSQKVTHAAGRLMTHYPTVACGFYKRADFEVVGTVVCEPGQTPRLVLTNVTLAQEWDALPKRRL